jgi:hypothetical protein
VKLSEKQNQQQFVYSNAFLPDHHQRTNHGVFCPCFLSGLSIGGGRVGVRKRGRGVKKKEKKKKKLLSLFSFVFFWFLPSFLFLG